MTHDLKYIEQTLKLWQEWAPNIDTKLTSEYNIASSSSLEAKKMHECMKPDLMLYKPKDKSHVTIVGLYLGKKCKLMNLLKPFEDLKIHYDSFTIKTVSYLESARNFAGKPHRLPFFKNKSSFVDIPINSDGIKLIKKYFECAPDDSRLEFQAFGDNSKVNKVCEKGTAFPHRNSIYWCGFSTLWYNENDQDIHIEWIRRLWNSFQIYSNDQCYVNFSDSDLGDEYMDYYYKDNKHRLIKIKNKYDPEYVFDFPQVVKFIK